MNKGIEYVGHDLQDSTQRLAFYVSSGWAYKGTGKVSFGLIYYWPGTEILFYRFSQLDIYTALSGCESR